MEHLLSFISSYGAWFLLPMMIVEGPVVTIIASFLASLGVLNIVLVYFLALLGNIIGDIIYYSIGKFGRATFIKKYGKYIGLHEKNIEYIENHYKNHLLKTILLAKATEVLVVPTIIASGIAKVKIKKFIPIITAIEAVKVFIIVLIGFYFGKFYQIIGIYLKDAILAFGITFSIFVLILLIYRKLKPKKI